MDSLTMTFCGNVGRNIRGLYLDAYRRETYGFSLACNFKHGHDESVLWVQASVREPHLLSLCLERAVYTGEKLLIVSHEVTQDCGMYNGQPRAYLRAVVSGLTFLTQVYPDAMVSTTGAPRIINFADLNERAG